MASSSGGLEEGPSSPWRNSNGQFGGSRGAEGERGDSISGSLQAQATTGTLPFSRERDRDKNYQTVCNLLSMLTLGVDQQQQQLPAESTPTSASNSGSTATGDIHRMLLMNMANTPESCLALRRAGCIPLLIELLHPPQTFNEGVEPAPEIIRLRAARALKNIVQFNPDEKVKRKELRVLKLLEGIRLFSEAVRAVLNVRSQLSSGSDDQEYQVANDASAENVQHPTSNITALMKLSFDEEHRNTMCLLGAIHALADLIVSDHLIHGDSVSELKDDCLLLRRYSGMTLTNLTFGDGTNKALLCGMKEFLCCLVTQLDCRNEDICQVTASVLRNLSWHADSSSRAALRGSDAVSKLTVAAINSTKESTLKATLSALWNLSAHSAANKSAICLASSSALPFLISLLRPNNPVMKQMKTPMTIIENAGGILRNISSQISSSSELRKSLRENHCYEILLEHLKSSSLTVVSNACGTLWSLSGGNDCEEDQRKLLDLNAIPMLKSLVYSKHERISQGASSALRNLLSSRFAKDHTLHLDSRLTAQIYSPSPSEREQGHYINDPSQKSPGSDTEFDVDFNSHHQNRSSQNLHKAQLLQRDPPVAHQQSSSSAASFFHRSNFKTTLPSKQLPLHFHNHPPFAQPVNYSNRPSTINYDLDSEPLDLTMTSAKSSPIHVISAAEFGTHSMQHPKRTEGGKVNVGFYRPKSHNQQLSFLNSPNLIHSTENASPSPGSLTKYSFPSAKFNRSCPEILSRLQQNLTPVHQPNPDTKPLDYSSTSGSTASSSRGAGEAVGISNDSTGGGDTTFNYSLQYTEIETDDEPNNSHNRGNLVAKSDDTVKTYCYEGTPNNFSVSNSCQDLVQELEYEKEKDKNTADRGNVSEKSTATNKLQPIDEVPKAYYVENTPAVFSRTSSLSSINSSGGLNAGENRAEFGEPPIRQVSGNDLITPRQDCFPPQPMPRKKLGSAILQSSTPARVTFSAEETPLMFSRCSSVASLDSLDVGTSGGGAGTAQKNDDDLSDYSRRASEVVSPSDLPDSPRALAPPVHMYDQKPANANIIVSVQKKVEDEDSVKNFSMEERSGLNSCRSLSPLTVDGEFLPVIGVGKLDMKAGVSTDISSPTVSKSSVTTPSSTFKSSIRSQELPNGGVLQIKDEHGKPSPKPRVFPDDELKVFAMEGTPFYGVSNATSLSDLTMDLEDKPQPKPTLPTSVGPAIKPAKDEESKPTDLTSKGEKLVKEECKKSEAQLFVEEEPIYSDAQLLEKCIRVGKAMGIPKSQSEFHLGTKGSTLKDMTDSTSSILMTVSLQEDNTKRLENLESKSQEFDDPDLAALIMIGRNRPKEKSHGRSKSYKKSDKEPFKFPKLPPIPTEVRISLEKVVVIKAIKTEDPAQVPKIKSQSQFPIQDVDNGNPPSEDGHIEGQAELATPTETGPTLPPTELENEEPLSPQTPICPQDPNQISTTSLGSEWNDETPTFSSPIPSMSISTAFRLAGSVLGDSMNSNQLPASKVENEKLEKQKVNSNCMNASTISVSLQNDLLENVEPPSTFSNLVSSSDCMMLQSPQLNIKSQQSNLTDRLNKRWRALNDSANASSTHSNLSGQKPPPDFDLENSMISVASIKSEIYELSSTSMNNDIFESAVEELESRPGLERATTGDISLGGNTYTIFPPENANGLTGAKSTDLSDGGNTVVSEDFTDAEDIEDFETAPADDNIEDLNTKPEKTDREKEIAPEANIKALERIGGGELEELNLNQASNNEDAVPSQKSPSYPSQKPLMEVHPLDSSNKYNTFVIKKVSMSPKSSPKQKRREDPDRYKTRTINPLNNSGKIAGADYNRDANGNPELKFATFRIGGPKIIKPLSNANYRESDTSLSPDSTPGSSPKGLRGRRKPLYSSLPPSSIIRKRTTPPPVPPKPARAGSPARSTASSTSGVYVRPTRTSELRMVANSSRDNSPPGPSRSTSKNSSNSSLNLIHQSSRSSDAGGSTVSASRPRIAPKPPVRTTPSMPQFTTGVSKGFIGSTASMQMKTSNSSFGFGQQARIGDSGSVDSSMKGYSTLPKSSKLGTEMGRYFNEKFSHSGESKESIPGSEKSNKSGMGKITTLWRKMDFRGHHQSKESASSAPQIVALHQGTGRKNFGEPPPPLPEKKSSKFSNLFGRKHKDKSTPKPFREPLPSHPDPPVVNPANDSTLNPTGGVWVRRDGDNKVIVPPFNYTPPNRQNEAKTYGDLARQDDEDLTDRNNAPTEPILSSASSNNAGSAKITTV